MDISQTITCSSMADSDLGFIAVYSRHCLTAPIEDGTRESRTIPALLLHMLHETTLLLLQSKCLLDQVINMFEELNADLF